MLKSLKIQNILLVDNIEVDFKEGLNVVTGETGAGKSIILNCFNLIIGNIASSNLVAHNNKTGTITVVFDVKSLSNDIESMLRDLSIENSGELIIRRCITLSGKNRIYINDVMVPLSTLRRITNGLCEIHSQREQQSILDTSRHREFVDSYARNNELLASLVVIHNKIQKLNADIKEVQELKNNREKEKAFLEFTVQELEKLSVKADEETELINTRIQLKTQKKRTDLISQIIGEIDNSGIQKILFDIQKVLVSNTDTFAQYEKQKDAINTATEKTIDEVEKIKELLQNILDNSPSISNLIGVEERLFALKDASNKYNTPINKLNDFLNECYEKLSSINKCRDDIESFNKELSDLKKQYYDKAKALTGSRNKTAFILEGKIKDELKHLKLEKAVFKIKIETDVSEANINVYGQDRVQFLASTNPGQPLAPLNKIVSGGELSRFMLAIKVILANKQNTNNAILVFDEIDTGIGGATADAVGQRLKNLSSYTQLLVVTHHPQVASLADLHLLVKKDNKKDTTSVSIKALTPKERKAEIARMLSGAEITKEAIAAASRLLEDKTLKSKYHNVS